jgi:hypothetical protein
VAMLATVVTLDVAKVTWWSWRIAGMRSEVGCTVVGRRRGGADGLGADMGEVHGNRSGV